MTTSPVHLAPSRAPASAASSAAQSGTAGPNAARGAAFDLLFALQLGEDGSAFIAPGETPAEASAGETAPGESTAQTPAIDPAQWMWPPMTAMANRMSPQTAGGTSSIAAEGQPGAIDAAAASSSQRPDVAAGVGSESPSTADAHPDAGQGLAAPDKPAFMLPAAQSNGDAASRTPQHDSRSEASAPVAGSLPPPPATPLAPSAQASIPAPVGTAAFADQMAQQVAVFIDQKQLTAQVQVHPPELGPVDMQIKISADQVQVDFFATQADTRDALETAIPRLKEMLAEQGLNLSGSHVGTRDEPARFAQGFGQGDAERRNAEAPDAARNATSGPSGSDTAAPGAAALHLRAGVPRLVDTFA